MNTKELVQQGYDFFGKGDMEGFMGILHDDVTWVFPGESHPLSGSHKGKENLMMNMSKIPQLWQNFAVIPEFMISEGNKVFVKCQGKADGMDTIFGHYFEVMDDKLSLMITFDDTLSMVNAMKK